MTSHRTTAWSEDVSAAVYLHAELTPVIREVETVSIFTCKD